MLTVKDVTYERDGSIGMFGAKAAFNGVTCMGGSAQSLGHTPDPRIRASIPENIA